MNAAFVSSEVNIKAMANSSDSPHNLNNESILLDEKNSSNLAIVPASSSTTTTTTEYDDAITIRSTAADYSNSNNSNNNNVDRQDAKKNHVKLDDLKNVPIENEINLFNLQMNNERVLYFNERMSPSSSRKSSNKIGADLNRPKIQIDLNNHETLNPKDQNNNQSLDRNFLTIKSNENTMHNSSSQSSIDTRIKFGEENIDMIPLMPSVSSKRIKFFF